MTFDLSTIHGWLRLMHVVPGFVGLAAFWVPIFSAKGGRWHVVFGKAFGVCALIVIVSALTSSLWMLLDPVGFSGGHEPGGDLQFVGILLGTLAYFTLVALVLSLWAVWTRRTPERLAAGWVRTLIAGMGLVSLALMVEGSVRVSGDRMGTGAILLGLGVAGLRGAWKSYRQVTASHPPRMHWWYLHMEHMLTTGIAFHTAFTVFGLGRLAGNYLTGPWQLVPWLLPSAIGIPATVFWVRVYQQKFEPTPVGDKR
ncbi:MAG: hypothetical protein U0746_19415 [Gemmataceae bacterium]